MPFQEAGSGPRREVSRETPSERDALKEVTVEPLRCAGWWAMVSRQFVGLVIPGDPSRGSKPAAGLSTKASRLAAVPEGLFFRLLVNALGALPPGG